MPSPKINTSPSGLRRPIKWALTLALVGSGLLGFSGHAGAATVTVTSTTDAAESIYRRISELMPGNAVSQYGLAHAAALRRDRNLAGTLAQSARASGSIASHFREAEYHAYLGSAPQRWPSCVRPPRPWKAHASYWVSTAHLNGWPTIRIF